MVSRGGEQNVLPHLWDLSEPPLIKPFVGGGQNSHSLNWQCSELCGEPAISEFLLGKLRTGKPITVFGE